jgi:effector-binding domain-containing protein
MKAFLKIILGIVLLIVIIGVFLPASTHVERTAVVKGNPESVFMLINNLKEWEKWSPWHKIDPKMTIAYSDTFVGAGASYSWKSDHDNVGNGKMTILESSPYSMVKTEMNFMENGIASGGFYLKPVEAGTEVKWTMDSDAGWNIIARYFGLMVDKFVGPDFEKGLRLLDSVAQTVKSEEFTMDLEFTSIPAQKFLLLKATGVKEADIGKTLGEIYGKIGAALGENGLKMMGAPMTFYEEPLDGNFTFEAGMPIDIKPKKPLTGGLIFKELQASEAVVAHFSGSYDKTGAAYPALENLMKEKGKSPIGMPMESYISDPMAAKTPLDIKTDIIWPVK